MVGSVGVIVSTKLLLCVFFPLGDELKTLEEAFFTLFYSSFYSFKHLVPWRKRANILVCIDNIVSLKNGYFILYLYSPESAT
jgi:hypothetical protein